MVGALESLSMREDPVLLYLAREERGGLPSADFIEEEGGEVT